MSALIVFFAGFLAAGELLAQNFINDGANAQYNASCSGVIRIKGNDATPRFVNQNGANIGIDAANAIDGVVEYNSNTDGQGVQGELHYTRLILTGTGDKTMGDNIYVYGADACPTLTGTYAELQTYPFYYNGLDADFGTGTFHYAGDNQTIFPIHNGTGGQPNNYYILNVTGGSATIVAAENTGAHEITTDASSPLTVNGNLFLYDGTSNLAGTVDVAATGSITTGAGAVTFAGALESAGAITTGDGDVTATSTTELTGTATFDVAGDGDVALNGATTTAAGTTITLTGTGLDAGNLTFGSTLTLGGDLVATDAGIGDVTFAGATNIAATGTIDLGDGNDIIILSTISNAGDGTNLEFACNSTVTYDGDGLAVLPTLLADANSYGNLVLITGSKIGGTAGYGTDVNLCGNFSLADGNFNMTANNGTLFLRSLLATATYGGGTGNEEVIGNMGRVTDGTARNYTFNNRNTSVELGANATNPDLVTMYVNPNEAPLQYVATTDVDRKVSLTYANNSGEFPATVQVGYLEDETTGWNPGPEYSQDRLRMYEANTTDIEKIATGNAYGTFAASGANLGFVQLAGILSTSANIGAAGNDMEHFFSSNDIVLRTGPLTFFTINDGRWTNPNTWDEGDLPSQFDDAVIRHVVYAGIAPDLTDAFVGTLRPGNTTTEESVYQTDPAANTITIAQVDQGAGERSALIIGNEDNPADYVFQTRNISDHSLIIANTAAPTIDIAGRPVKNSIVRNTLNGLWLMSIGANTPIFSTWQINSQGTINNEGIIEVGE